MPHDHDDHKHHQRARGVDDRHRVDQDSKQAPRTRATAQSEALPASAAQLSRFDRALLQLRSAVRDAPPEPETRAVAASGITGGGARLPHLDRIQAAFGHHDVTGVRAHTGVAAEAATEQLQARAYAMGNDTVLGSGVDLHTVAHEAAHVVQQRGGVALKGGVGQVGDRHEVHADAVADAVVAGRSAEALLDRYAPHGGTPYASVGVQRQDVQFDKRTDEEEERRRQARASTETKRREGRERDDDDGSDSKQGRRGRYDVTGGHLTKDRRGHIRAVGRGFGDRDDDRSTTSTNADGEEVVTGPKNARVTKINSITRPDLSVIDEDKHTQELGDGPLGGRIYRGHRHGTGSEWSDPKLKHNGDYSLGEGNAAIGTSHRLGWENDGSVEGEHGTLSHEERVEGIAEFGASTGASLDQDGAHLDARIGGQLGVRAEGKLTAKSRDLKMEGVDDPLNAEMSLGGDVFGGVRAGAGADLSARTVVGEDGKRRTRIGAEVKADAFAGLEARARLRGHLGPLGGEANVSGFVGAGAGASAGIYYEDGKIHIGGRMYAAVGYGAGVGGNVEIDIKQAYQMMTAAGKAAYKTADADGDGRLTAIDAAEHAGRHVNDVAEGVDRGVTGLLEGLDATGDGRIDGDDIEAGMERAGELISELPARGQAALERTTEAALEAGQDALTWGGDRVDDIGTAYRNVRGMIDEDGDGELSAREVGGAVYRGVKGLNDRVTETREAAGKQVADAAHKLFDQTGDGRFDGEDVAKLYGEAKQAVSDKVSRDVATAREAVKQVREQASQARRALSEYVDQGEEGFDRADAARIVGDAKRVAGRAVDSAKKSVGDVKRRAAATVDRAVNAANAAAEAAGAQVDRVREYVTGGDGLDAGDVARLVRDGGEAAGRAAKRAGAAMERAGAQAREVAKGVGENLKSAGERVEAHAKTARETVSRTRATVNRYLGHLWN